MAKSQVDQFKYTEHERKPVIRMQWCLPQIRILSEKVKKKLIYIGLPGIDALDIKAWLQYIDKVIAFQCSEYKEGSATKLVDVMVLDNYLYELERQGLIRPSVVYQGFMEDIVMGGLSERGQIYIQDDFLKIYNLDFCNNITTPRTIRNERGKLVYHYKLQVIERLLEHQKKGAEANKGHRFIMYLTINSNVFDSDISKIKNKEFTDYIKNVKKITKPEVVAVRLMKAYCFYELREIFTHQGFNAEFLPPIFYQGSAYPNKNQGSKDQFHRMMTFTILGTKLKEGQNGIPQEISSFLNTKFAFANNKTLQCYTDKYMLNETNFISTPTELLTQTNTYKFLW